jgi:gamma-glutamylcyclotransferase (GGCT)/AIG2-like uncharacterized protein YtfP
MSFNLFVYGTLRRGGPAHDRLAGCEHVGEGKVGGVLYDIDGRFPALLHYGETPVYGEIWRCPAELLLQLDRFEGVDSGLFRRRGIEVETERGEVPCWTYTAGPALSRKLQPDRRIRSGRWAM